MAQGRTTTNFTSVDSSGGFYVNGTQIIDSNGDVLTGVSAADITLASAKILVGNASNVATGVSVSGDVSIDNAGATTVDSVDLETATVTSIADTEVLIGTGAGTANFAALSGDATMANTGVVTVSGATGNFDIGGAETHSGITATSGAGAVAITGRIHEVTTTGTGDALTLADGSAGQRLTVLYVAEGAGGDTAVITPTTLAGGSTITLNALGDSAELVYSSTGGWHVVGLGGTAAVA